jgi:HK97 gp10 family phage protein
MSDFKVTSKVIGMPDLQKAFDRLEENVAGDNLETAAQAGALIIRNAGSENAPKRTRTLSRSIHIETLVKQPKYVEMGIGTDLDYAAIQEFGGTITPKKGKFLAIPLTAEARAHVSPRDFPEELTPRFGGNGGVLVDGAGIAQYALARSVTIPAHPYMRPALDENEEAVLNETGDALRQLLEPFT